MNKKNHIKLSPILLLLIYAISISPTMMMHHHESDIVAYEYASSCEKTIYYHSEQHHCGHREHISKPIEKCFLCDHHSTALFTFDFAKFSFFKDNLILAFFDFHESILVDFSILFLNKGPPSI